MVVLTIVIIVVGLISTSVSLKILSELLLVEKKLSKLETKLSHISSDTEKLINWKVMD